MRNRCKNITLPQTSFAGGKNVRDMVLSEYWGRISSQQYEDNFVLFVKNSKEKKKDGWAEFLFKNGFVSSDNVRSVLNVRQWN